MSAKEKMKDGQDMWNEKHMPEFIEEGFVLGMSEHEVLMYWTGYLSSFLGSMASSVGFPATKEVLNALSKQIIDNAEGIINPDS